MHSRIFLETGRLRLRHFTDTDADAELLVALDSDPEVMRYLGNGRPTPSDVIRHEVLPRFARSQVWAAEERSTGHFVGWFALTPASAAPPTTSNSGTACDAPPGAAATPRRAPAPWSGRPSPTSARGVSTRRRCSSTPGRGG